MKPTEHREAYQCHCCGQLTIGEPGGYEICEVCGWEDDPVQSADPTYTGGGNVLNLYQARLNWKSGNLGLFDEHKATSAAR
ncbi:CPCC family cysteine-rich protein [Cupriavidus sp. H18C1]|uniref:CPCC family cysteine-rich protein n=1 Tax=Cupriavidus sp. H18C1 TaxID=3241601 RepID=UPI003BB85CDD